MAGQLGVGLATRIGHSSLVDRVLLKINLEIFIPNTLEIWLVYSLRTLNYYPIT